MQPFGTSWTCSRSLGPCQSANAPAVRNCACTPRSLFAWLVAYGRASLSAKCFWWPLWLLAGPCIPLVVLLGYVVAMLCGLAYVGPECGVLAYLCT